MTAQNDKTADLKDAFLRKLRVDIGKLNHDSDADTIGAII